jgi:SAM-dependent methyltransferase
MGRNSFWPMINGAKGGIAIDLDDRALEAAKANLLCFPSVEVHRLSVYDIEWEDAFDIVFAVGVIHHLAWPEQALQRMKAAVKPGGQVAIWVYGRENNGWMLWALDPLRKMTFSRMPLGLVHALSNVPAAILYSLLRMGLNQIEYFRLLRRFSYRHLRSIVFDQMLPRTAFYWRREEVRSLMRSADLTDIKLVWVNEMSWAAVGTKPVKSS